MRRQHVLLSASFVAFVVGCGGSAEEMLDDEEENMVGEANLAIEVENALNPNALNPNALNPNALNPNALSLAALTALQRSDLSGEYSRSFLKYAVSCALNPSQKFDVSPTSAVGGGRINDLKHLRPKFGTTRLRDAWDPDPLGKAKPKAVEQCSLVGVGTNDAANA